MSELALPEGWVSTKLGNYMYLKNGYAFKSAEYLPQDNKNIPLIRIGDIQDNTVSTASSVFVKANEQAESFVVNKGDLLIAMSGATTGKMGVYQESRKAYQNQRVGNIKFVSQNLGSESFRNYLIQSLKQTIHDIAYGGAQPNISAKAIENIEITLPSLNEQEVISQILNQYLTTVSQIQARLDAIPKLIEKFRQSVLNDAFCGKLTQEWRTANNIEFDWKDIELGDVSRVNTGKTPLRKDSRYWENGTIPWLTSSVTGQSYCYEAKEYVTKVAVEENNLKLFPKGSLLIAMYGEGKTRGQVTELMLEAACNQACAVIEVDNELALTSFIKLKLIENYVETRKAASGGNQPNLNLSKVRAIRLDMPSIEEQKEIVKQVNQLFAHSDQIEKSVAIAKARVDNLTQSILHQAFTGNLTKEWREQNPELISGDNSAEALLAKIEAEKQGSSKKNLVRDR